MFDCSRLIQVEGRLCAISAGTDQFNRGGLVELLVVPESHILSVPSYRFSFDENQEASLSGNIRIASSAQAYRFYFSPETGSFSESMQEDDNGTYYDQLLTIQIPKDRPGLTWLKHQMRHQRYALVYRDQNGIAKLLRNQRVKFDLDTRRAPAEYNGHTMTARRAARRPALHWPLTAGQSIEDIFEVAVLTLGHESFSFPSGFASGESIALDFAPVSLESVVVIIDNSLKLQPGTHYTLSGNQLQLQFTQFAEAGSPATIHLFYAYQATGTEIGGFAQHTETYSSSYLAGETFTLPSSPISSSHLYITYNDSLLLRPGTDYNLSGADVEILFAGSPSVGDEDVFSCYYATAGTPIILAGWKQYIYKTKFALPSGTIITLPSTPISNSLMAWYDESMRLRAGTHYNLSGNEVEILFDVPITGPDNPSVLDFWYAY